ncbi:MAG: class I SAM-dependent methyltransferase [Chloroflexota bacterium]
MTLSNLCSNCLIGEMTVFHQVQNAPVHSVLLLKTREEALNYPQRNIELGYCQTCGFMSNQCFEPDVHDYSAEYEATQAYSATFNQFHQQLAERLTETYQLYHKRILEIGCGQGEFLKLLCEVGDNQGIGFDPAYRADDEDANPDPNLTFIADFYSEKYAHYQSDFVCCKMTLEHIPNTSEFVGMVRRAVGDDPNTVVFFQIPNMTRILKDVAFWDIYYEHCSYFTALALRYVFQLAGFEVMQISTAYNDQYLMIEVRPSSHPPTLPENLGESRTALADDVAYFTDQYNRTLERWRASLAEMKQKNERVVIWGSGSKGVAFLTALNIREQIQYTVDINPRKTGTYMAGTCQEIVAPEFLQAYQPAVVIVMNPIYCDEVQADLDRLGVKARLMTV